MDAFSLLQHVVLIHHLHVGRKCRLHSSLFILHFPVAKAKPLIIGMGGSVFPFSITAMA